jgi:hypothetical protein
MTRSRAGYVDVRLEVFTVTRVAVTNAATMTSRERRPVLHRCQRPLKASPEGR